MGLFSQYEKALSLICNRRKLEGSAQGHCIWEPKEVKNTSGAMIDSVGSIITSITTEITQSIKTSGSKIVLSGGGREARKVGNTNPLIPHTFTEDGLTHLVGFKKQKSSSGSYQYVSPDGQVFQTIPKLKKWVKEGCKPRKRKPRKANTNPEEPHIFDTTQIKKIVKEDEILDDPLWLNGWKKQQKGSNDGCKFIVPDRFNSRKRKFSSLPQIRTFALENGAIQSRGAKRKSPV